MKRGEKRRQIEKMSGGGIVMVKVEMNKGGNRDSLNGGSCDGRAEMVVVKLVMVETAVR